MRHLNTEFSYSDVEYMFKTDLDIKLSHIVTYLLDVINRVLKDTEIVTTTNPWRTCRYISARDYAIVNNAVILITDIIDKDISKIPKIIDKDFDKVKQIISKNLNINLDNLVIYEEKK